MKLFKLKNKNPTFIVLYLNTTYSLPTLSSAHQKGIRNNEQFSSNECPYTQKIVSKHHFPTNLTRIS